MDKMTVLEEPIWSIERRDSSGHLFWSRASSKVKFRCDVEVLEYVKDPSEHDHLLEDEYFNDTNLTNENSFNRMMLVCATCVAAIAVTILLPWFLIGGTS